MNLLDRISDSAIADAHRLTVGALQLPCHPAHGSNGMPSSVTCCVHLSSTRMRSEATKASLLHHIPARPPGPPPPRRPPPVLQEYKMPSMHPPSCTTASPWVLQDALDRDALCRVHHEDACQQVLAVGRQAGRPLGERVLGLEDALCMAGFRTQGLGPTGQQVGLHPGGFRTKV